MRTRPGFAIIPSVKITRGSRLAWVVALLVLAVGQAACITRTVRKQVFDREGTTVILRGKKKGSEPVDQGFQHPAHVAPVRVAHILSRIDLRRSGDDQERVPAIPLETLFTIADGVAMALAEADSSQEVAVQSIRRGKHWGIFDRHYLTSLLVFMRDELLYIYISRSEWEIPRGRKERLPETHVGEHPSKFRLVVERGMALVDLQGAAADWRDPIFKRPSRTRVTRSGRVVRRQVLMESLEDDTDMGPSLSGDLSPDQLRALADLEEARREGQVSEGEYNTRRRRILRGDLNTP